jgi:hypothetical protein
MWVQSIVIGVIGGILVAIPTVMYITSHSDSLFSVAMPKGNLANPVPPVEPGANPPGGANIGDPGPFPGMDHSSKNKAPVEMPSAYPLPPVPQPPLRLVVADGSSLWATLAQAFSDRDDHFVGNVVDTLQSWIDKHPALKVRDVNVVPVGYAVTVTADGVFIVPVA